MPHFMCGMFVVVMDQNDLDQFKNLFFSTANEHINNMLAGLDAFGKNSHEQNLADFRLHAHSLKGECIAMGFNDLGSISKVIERITKAAIEQHMLLSVPLVTEMKKTVLKMKESLRLMQAEDKHLEFNDDILRLKELSGVTIID